MGRKADISREKVVQIETLLREKTYSLRQLAKKNGVSLTSVRRINAAMKTGQAVRNRAGKCGRKRATTPQDERVLVRTLRSRPLSTSAELQSVLSAAGVTVSARTVRRRLSQLQCKNIPARVKPILTKQMMKKRLEFAKKYELWTVDQWKKVSIFIMCFTSL